MPELRGNLMITGSPDIFRKELLLIHREQPVAVDTDHSAVSLDPSQSRNHTPATAPRIVAVDRIAEIIVRISIETVRQLLALVTLV